MDATLLHDLKRIANGARELMEACDALYNDIEEKLGGKVPPVNGRVSIMDITKGGKHGPGI